jgi:hypothetical protein
MVGPRLAAVARHEAAHAALALRLGRAVLRLAIRDDGSGWCEVAPPSYARTPANARRAAREDLLIVLAGDAVERVPEPVRGWWRL